MINTFNGSNTFLESSTKKSADEWQRLAQADDAESKSAKEALAKATERRGYLNTVLGELTKQSALATKKQQQFNAQVFPDRAFNPACDRRALAQTLLQLRAEEDLDNRTLAFVAEEEIPAQDIRVLEAVAQTWKLEVDRTFNYANCSIARTRERLAAAESEEGVLSFIGARSESLITEHLEAVRKYHEALKALREECTRQQEQRTRRASVGIITRQGR